MQKGTYFGGTEFDLAKLSDVKPYTCSPIRKLKTEEVYLIGDLKTIDSKSEISGHRIYIEPNDEEQYNQAIAANGKSAVVEGYLVVYTFENGHEECGLLISAVNPIPVS